VTKLRALLLGLSLTLLLSAGCAVGPNYKRPSVDVPGMYRGATPQEVAQPPASQSFGDQKWWEVFHHKGP
jgi:multidrug efflux system outer membrane protein